MVSRRDRNFDYRIVHYFATDDNERPGFELRVNTDTHTDGTTLNEAIPPRH